MFDFHWNASNLKKLDTFSEKNRKFAGQPFFKDQLHT